MTKGIVLPAFSKQSYYYFAANLALSIKHHNAEMPILLLTDSGFNLSVFHRSLFDEIVVLPDNILYPTGILDPANVKLNLYEFLPYDYNMILDVDALCVSSLDYHFDSMIQDGGYFYTKLIDTHTIDKGRLIPNMVWAFADDIWKQYTLSNESVLPCINSSFMFVKKCDEAKELYRQALENYSNPIPLNKLRNQWGGGQPDELYMNIAMAQKGITGKAPVELMYLCNKMSEMPLHKLAETFPIFSYFGNKNAQRSIFLEYYDSKLIKWYYEKGQKHIYKWSNIKADKHANIKPKKFAPSYTVYKDNTLVPSRVAGSVQLIVPFFKSKNDQRNKELITVLNKNIDNKEIDSIILVCDEEIQFTHEKLTCVNIGKRQTYKDIFSYSSDGINIIANADIYFDDRSIRLIKSANLKNKVMALSRYDIKPNGAESHFNYEWSQDSWIYKGILDLSGMDVDFIFGKPACDNRIAYELSKRYTVFNPSFNVKSYHLHLSQERTYTEKDRLQGQVKAVPCETLKDMKKRMLIKQPGKVGDILICLPIAKFYSEEYLIDWECPPMYHDLFSYVDYAIPVTKSVGVYDKIIDLSFGLGGEPEGWWRKNRDRYNSFVEAKYELASVPVSIARNLQYKRDMKKEQALFDSLVKDEKYAIVHRVSDYGTPPEIETDLPVIEIVKKEGYSLFDWRKVIAGATEIHCIDSSPCNLIDAMPEAKDIKKYYYVTDRIQHKWQETILTNNWTRINVMQAV